MKPLYSVVTAAVILLSSFITGCNNSKSSAPHTATPSTVTPNAKILLVANNYSDKDWQAGIYTKGGDRNIFYFLIDPSSVNPVTVGTNLVFARSGAAKAKKVVSTPQDGRIAVFVTVDRALDPADGFPNPIVVQ